MPVDAVLDEGAGSSGMQLTAVVITCHNVKIYRLITVCRLSKLLSTL